MKECLYIFHPYSEKESILCLIFYGETTKELHSNLLRSSFFAFCVA